MPKTTRGTAARRKAHARTAETDDPSRDAVYAWEDSWREWNQNTLTLTECRSLVRRACRAYRIAHPTVKQHGDGLSWSVPSLKKISLQSESRTPGNGGKNKATALHEAAHHIAFHRYGERIQDHGPTFLAIFMGLLVQFGAAPAEALAASARKHGLRWRNL